MASLDGSGLRPNPPPGKLGDPMAVSTADRGLVLGDVIAILGGVAAAIGVLLPWQSVAGGGSGTVQGLDYSQGPFPDGLTFLILAILTVVASAARLFAGRLPEGLTAGTAHLLGPAASVAIMCGLIISSLGVLFSSDVSRWADGVNRLAAGTASVGVGLYLDVAAGVVMIAGGAIGLLAGRRQSKP
jgi:hypothetical protein